MPIKDPDVMKLIEKLSIHYTNNISNRFIRKALMVMNLSQATWNYLERLTEKSDFYAVQGYEYEDLYEQILAAANFVYQAKIDVLPNIKGLAGINQKDTPRDKILREMAIKNFNSNLPIFADMINELYIKVTEIDKAQNKKCIFERIPELKTIGQLLIG
jgi:hypothetical protein